MSKQFFGCIPAAKLVTLVPECQPERAAEVELVVTVGERIPVSLRGVLASGVVLLRVKGWVRCTIQQTCARCLNLFSILLEVDVDRLFVPGSDPAESNSQQEMLEDLTYLDDNHFALAPMVAEELLLAFPMIPLCQPSDRQECAGLCSGCGVDLNKEDCLCEKKVLEGPFAALRDFVVRGANDQTR